MARHSVAPSFVKLFYERTGCQHVMNLCCTLQGTPVPGEAQSVWTASGTFVSAATAIGALVTALKACFASDMSFTRWEIWYKPQIDSDPIFIHSGIVVGGVGTSGTESYRAGQVVCVTRTAAGNIAKLYLMEASIGSNQIFTPPNYDGSAIKGVYEYLLGTTNWVLGRDGSHPIAGLRALSKTNDALRKKLYLNS